MRLSTLGPLPLFDRDIRPHKIGYGAWAEYKWRDKQLHKYKQLLVGGNNLDKTNEKQTVGSEREKNLSIDGETKQFVALSVKINQYLIIWFCSSGSGSSFVFQRASAEQLYWLYTE